MGPRPGGAHVSVGSCPGVLLSSDAAWPTALRPQTSQSRRLSPGNKCESEPQGEDPPRHDGGAAEVSQRQVCLRLDDLGFWRVGG